MQHFVSLMRNQQKIQNTKKNIFDENETTDLKSVFNFNNNQSSPQI